MDPDHGVIIVVIAALGTTTMGIPAGGDNVITAELQDRRFSSSAAVQVPATVGGRVASYTYCSYILYMIASA